MTATTAEPASRQRGGSWLFHRQLNSYPATSARLTYLAITVLATVMLYYELYVGGSVSTLILANFHMSFTFYVLALAFGNLIGAFGSLFAGLTDRFGRANLVVFGLLFTAVFVTWILPAAPNKWAFVIEGFVVGMVEGICLVATPALIRDFSPQVGRATAMGFWTSGPVLGSLIVAEIGTITIPATESNPAFWSHEYRICGYAGIVVFLIALVALRELSPQLRDQLMVTMRDRALIEARAKGIDIAAALRHPWQQLMKADIIISAIAVSIMLLIYYTAVGFSVIYLNSVFGVSLKNANALGNWNWGFNAIGVILIGVVSDRFRVRKPFMVIGAVLGAVMVVFYLGQAGHHPTYYTLALMLALMAFGLGVAYTPWMASFTETVEHRNPALLAHGLAIWGWIIRVIIFLAFLVIPVVINTVTPLVNYGSSVLTYSTKYPSLVWAGEHPTIIADVTTYKAQLTFASTHPSIVATAQTDSKQIVNAAIFAPELAVIQAHEKLFLEAQKYPTNKIPAALAAKLLKAAGGGVKGLGILTTLSANSAAIQGVIAAAPQLLALKPFTAQLKALSLVPSAVIKAVTAPVAARELAALQKVPVSVQNYMTAHGGAVSSAATRTAGQWKTWYWVCFAGIVLFLFSIPLLRGRWSPRSAKRDEAAHEAMVQAELAKLGAGEA